MILEQLPEVLKLPPDQKRQLAEELWLSAEDSNETTVDSAILDLLDLLDLLDQRLADSNANPAYICTWQEVRQRVFRGQGI